MRKIYRLRQRSSKVNHTMPWRTVYMMPTEALQAVYPTLGVAISFRWDPDNASTEWVKRFRMLPETAMKARIYAIVDELLQLDDYSVVVPVRVTPGVRPADLGPAARATRIETKGTSEHARHQILETLRTNVPAVSVALHFDTGPEGMEPLCGNCVNVQSHLMGQCTPGLIRCAPGVVVPAAERLVHIHRKAQQT